MAFDDYEGSVEAGAPIELYVFSLGSSIWRHHNSIDATITYSGDDYTPTEVSHGNIDTDDNTVEIHLPGDHELPNKFTSLSPGQTTSVTIYRYHRGDSDVRLLFKGTVRSVLFTKEGLQAALRVVPVAYTFDKPIPNRTYQAPCNHVLFDSHCQVVQSLYKYVGTVTVVSNNQVTVSGLESSKGDGWATGGYVEYGVLDKRLILNQSGDVLTLSVPFYETVLGESVNVYAGCDHSLSICASKFSNHINFGGCPYVPTKNIFTKGL